MAAITGAIAAGIGVASTLATTIGSFVEAGKQNDLAIKAQNDAERVMSEARKKLEVNYYDQLAIQKEPYEMAYNALLSQGAKGIEAAQEADRGAGAAAGRIQMAMTEAGQQQRAAMGKEMMDLEKLSATEDSRLRDINVQLDLEEVAGAQMAQAQAQQAAAQNVRQGFQGVVSLGQQVGQALPLYFQSGATKALGSLEKDYNQAVSSNQVPEAWKGKDGKVLPFQQVMGLALNQPSLGTMGQNAFNEQMIGMGRKDLLGIDLFNIQGQQPKSNQNIGVQQQMPMGQVSLNPNFVYGFTPQDPNFSLNPFAVEMPSTQPKSKFDWSKF